MTITWFLLTGVFFAAYVLLDGLVTGTAILHGRVGPGERARRATLTAFGPFFMASEVWLVVTAATLAATFPAAAHAIYASQTPLLVLLIVAWLVRDGAIWLRGRLAGAAWRAWWDRALGVAGLVLAATVGMLLGNLLTGRAAGGGPYLSWYALPWAVVMASLFALHGAVFLAVRLPEDLAERPVRLVRRCAPAVGAAHAALLLLGPLTQPAMRASGPLAWSLAVAAVGAAALIGAGRLVAARPRAALALTGLAPAGLVPVVGMVLWPVAEAGPAGAEALWSLFRLVIVVLVAVVAAQCWLWWTFLRRLDDRSAVWF